MQKRKPYIFDISQGRLEDGSGIRTVVFVKGCPLRCEWCHNPESHSQEQEYMWDAVKCFACGRCERSCPRGALSFADGRLTWNRDRCDDCARCQEVCPGGALRQVGVSYEVECLVRKLEQDKMFFDVSHGGVTFSGGEPLAYPDYIGEVAKELQARGISCCVETCGYFDYTSFQEKVLPHIQCILFDLKLMSEELHRKYTGRSNRLILENFKKLQTETVTVIPRTPLVPEITDTEENLGAIREFLQKLHLADRHVLLPYNSAGSMKYGKLLSRGMDG